MLWYKAYLSFCVSYYDSHNCKLEIHPSFLRKVSCGNACYWIVMYLILASRIPYK